MHFSTADAEDMKRVAGVMKNSDTSLAPPATWEDMDETSRALPLYEVQKSSAEFKQAEASFMHTLKNHRYYSSVKVRLWDFYAGVRVCLSFDDLLFAARSTR